MRVIRIVKKKLFAIILSALALTTFIYFYTDSNKTNKSLNPPINIKDLYFKNNFDSKQGLIGFIPDDEKQLIKTQYKNDSLYMLPVSQERLNTLFKIIQSKESSYHPILKKLNLISFSDLLTTNSGNEFNLEKLDESVYKQFVSEINTYLKNDNGQLVGNEKFIEDLNILSYYYSFLHKRNAVVPSVIKDPRDVPVIITAANSGYYEPLQSTVYLVHKHFPNAKLIVYDLGLTPEQERLTKEKCKCEVRKFDPSGEYSKTTPHISDLKTYAWKPLLIQEVLKEHELIMYMDSSIRLQSSDLEPIVKAIRKTGFLTQYIGLKLTCYTNPRMFEWYLDKANSYEDFFTIEANFIIMQRNFINSLLMKAWITCALDKNCIAPEGSSIGGCCGCHRFDQDALTISSTYFYGHPRDKNFLPAYSLTTNESFFFAVRRYEGMKYFK